MNKEQFAAQKRAEVAAIVKEQERLVKAAILLLKLPYKQKRTYERRQIKAMAYTLKAYILQGQILAIASKPFPKDYQAGSLATIGEAGPELIEIKNGQIIIHRPQIYMPAHCFTGDDLNK